MEAKANEIINNLNQLFELHENAKEMLLEEGDVSELNAHLIPFWELREQTDKIKKLINEKIEKTMDDWHEVYWSDKEKK